ncbi:MAG: hypothetical protein E2P02_05815 [Acidobacteria bacterium]|nr:MAG: hypothetical protein E2P02_05815 [Acidobacteriota bacterium]
MKFTGMFLATLLLVVMTVPSAKARSEGAEQGEAADAIVHLKKACEVVWTRGTTYQIDRCTRRAMAALGDENRLRDNELKRMLMQSDRELETCSDALEELKAEGSNADGVAPRTAARRKP